MRAGREEAAMGFKTGIVGLPNVGKSTLFNALTRTAAAQAANFPFCTIEPNVGEVNVPDARLDRLARNRAVQGRRAHPDDLRGHRGAGEGRLPGRGARQPVPRQHPRVRRDRPCAALLRGRRRHPCRGKGRPGGRRRDGGDRADARRSRERREAPRGAGAPAQGRRQGGGRGEPAAADGARRRWRRGVRRARSRWRPRTRGPGAICSF